MSTPLIQLRNKYADDLEEILQCPVCYENMCGAVPMCVQGHHVCIKCQPQVASCPFCKSFFNGTRNFLAETLASKFDEIKVSLIDPGNVINQKVLENVVCIGTQTEKEDNFENTTVKNNEEEKENNFKFPPPTSKGKFKCRINNCSEELAHGRMIPHLRYYHNENLIEEKISDSTSYTNTWNVEYQSLSLFNKAICIPNMGIFFLIININSEGDVFGSLSIVNSVANAKKFFYEIKINNLSTSISYKGKVIASRVFNDEAHQKSLFVHNKYMAHLLKKKFFKVSLTLIREFL